MHPSLKEMGYEPFAFIPDPDAGLKEGEEPPPPPMPTVEEADPDLLKYGPYREDELKIHVTPEWREAATRDPFIAEWVRIVGLPDAAERLRVHYRAPVLSEWSYVQFIAVNNHLTVGP
jgi:hypothetical protein